MCALQPRVLRRPPLVPSLGLTCTSRNLEKVLSFFFSRCDLYGTFQPEDEEDSGSASSGGGGREDR
jgi:hypothetical protein